MVKHNSDVIDQPNFIYLAAMMKSSSTLMWLVLDAIRNPDNRADPSTMEDVPADEFRPLTIDFLKHFPRGGVFKNHAPYEYHTDRFLKQTGCKCVLLVRHPADHLAGLYCHERGLRARGTRMKIPSERRTDWVFSAGPIPESYLDGDHHLAIGQMIRGGYVWKILEWMADWQKFRNPRQSRALKYEDVIGNFDAVVANLCRFIRDREPDDDLVRYLRHVFDHETTTGRQKGTLDKYPLGWTGRVGTYRDYFSATNLELYNEQVRKFLDSYPHASGLLALYPNLLLTDSCLPKEGAAN